MVQRSAPSDLIFVGISSVKLIFGCVMNVKFGKILLRLLDTEYHSRSYSTLEVRWLAAKQFVTL